MNQPVFQWTVFFFEAQVNQPLIKTGGVCPQCECLAKGEKVGRNYRINGWKSGSPKRWVGSVA